MYENEWKKKDLEIESLTIYLWILRIQKDNIRESIKSNFTNTQSYIIYKSVIRNHRILMRVNLNFIIIHTLRSINCFRRSSAIFNFLQKSSDWVLNFLMTRFWCSMILAFFSLSCINLFILDLTWDRFDVASLADFSSRSFFWSKLDWLWISLLVPSSS